MAADPSFTSSTVAATANAAAAVKALLNWKNAQSATEKPQLLPQDDFIYLNLTLKRIPQKTPTKPFKIPLPHPLLDSSSELCLIIDDRRTSNLTKETAQEIIKSQNLTISKVLKLSKLKTNYIPFEAKRKLCGSYDLFLVDRRIVHFLPKLLGKSFFKKKKLPLALDLTHKNWKEQIERATGSGLLYMRTGTCCVMKVGKISMESEEIVENVVEAVKGAVEVVPKKWAGVRSLHLKLFDSVALPLYQTLPDMKIRIEGAKESVKVSDVDIEVKEENREKAKKGNKKKKGRINEVRYMDVGAQEAELESDDGENADEKRNSQDDELIGYDEGSDYENEDKGSDYENEDNKSEGDDGVGSAYSEGDKSKKRKKKGNILGNSVDGKRKKKGVKHVGKERTKKGGSSEGAERKKKGVKHVEKEGTKKRGSSEGAEESIGKKESEKAFLPKKAKRSKTKV